MLNELLPEHTITNDATEQRTRDTMNEAFVGCDEDFTQAELADSVRKTKNHKAHGPDRIKGEIVKSIFGEIKEIRLEIFHKSWRAGIFPD